MADRLGVDVGVAGFSSFERNMSEVNRLMDEFAARSKQLKAVSEIFDSALKAIDKATKESGDGLTSFLRIARELSTNTKTLAGITRSLNNLASAFKNVESGSRGASGALRGLSIPSVPTAAPRAAQTATRDVRGPSSDALTKSIDKEILAREAGLAKAKISYFEYGKFVDSVYRENATDALAAQFAITDAVNQGVAQQKASYDSLKERAASTTRYLVGQANELAKARDAVEQRRRRTADRAAADDARNAQISARFQEQASKIAQKSDVVSQAQRQADVLERIRRRQQDRALSDEARFAAQAARVRANVSDIDARGSRRDTRRDVDTGRTTAAAEKAFADLSSTVQGRVAQLETSLRGKLADALLNRKDEQEVKRRIDSVVSDLQTRLQGIQSSRVGRVVDQSDIDSLRKLQAELKNVSGAQSQLIATQQKALNQTSVSRLARQRALDETSRLTAQQFATGKLAQAASSANPIIRTFARTIFAVEDASAAARLSTEAFGIIVGKALGTLKAISLPVRLLASALNFVGINASNATGPLNIFFRLAGFKGASGISALNQETARLSATFKNFKPEAFTAALDKTVKAAKKSQIEFRELAFELPAFQAPRAQAALPRAERPRRVQRGSEDPEADLAAAAERGRQARAAVFARAEADRSRSAQREADIAQRAGSNIQAIQTASEHQITALKQQQEAVRTAISQQSTQAQTAASRRRLQELTAVERQIGTAISSTQQSALRAVEAQNSALARTSGTAAKSLQAATPALDKFGNELRETSTEAGRASSSISRFGQIVQTAVGTALGNLAVNAVHNLTFALRGLVTTAVTAVKDYQQLQRVFASQVRVEILDSGQVTSFSEATALATVKAQELLGWAEQLAIVSPFESGQISQIFSLARSYTFTTDEAQKLTGVLVDFAAGSGRTIAEAEGIARALGQIRTNGRVLKEELNQLAERGVPALAILAKATGKTTEELNQFFRKGGSIDAESAIVAITKELGENFTGAAAEAQNSVAGLFSSINDLKNISLRNLATPLIESLVTPLGSTIVSAVNTPEFQQSLKDIGQSVANTTEAIVGNISQAIGVVQALFELIPEPVAQVAANFAKIGAAVLAAGAAFNILIPIVRLLLPVLAALVSIPGLIIGGLAVLATAWTQNWFSIQTVAANAVNSVLAGIQTLRDGLAAGNILGGLVEIPVFVQDIAQKVVQTTSDLLSSMVEFGANIVTSLAEGIIGAVGAVLDALAVLGSAITSLLAPGSPPKLLPELTEWGKGAADAYLEGFGAADFELLDKLSGTITDALTAIGDEVQSEQFTEITHAITGAIQEFNQFGAVSQSSLDSIKHVAEDFGEEIGTLAAAYFEAAGAAKRLEQLQEQLNQTTNQYAAILDPIDKRLKAIQGASASSDEAAEIKALQNVINNRFATEDQKRKAQLKLEELSLTQQKRSIEEQRDTAVDALQDRISIAEEEKKRAEETASVFEKRFGIELNAIKMLQAALEAAAGGADGLGDKLKKAKKEKEKLGEIDLGLGSLADLEFEAPDIAGGLAPAIEGFKKRIEEGKTGITTAFTDLKTKVQESVQGIVDAFNNGFAGIVDPNTTGLGRVAGQIGLIAGNIDRSVELVKTAIGGLSAAFSQGFAGVGPQETGSKGEEVFAVDPITDLARKAGAASASLSTAFTTAVTAAQGFATDFMAAFNTEEGSLVDRVFAALNAEKVQGRLATLGSNIAAEINSLFGSEQDGTAIDVTAIETALQTALNGLFAEGEVAVEGLATLSANVYNAVSKALGLDSVIDATVLKTNIINAVNALFGAEGESGEIVAMVVPKLDLLFGDVTFEDLATSFTNLTTGVKDAIEGIVWSEVLPVEVFGNLAESIGSSIKSIFDGLSALFSGDLGGATSNIQAGIEGLGGGLGQALGAGAGALGGILEGFDPGQIAGAIVAAITVFVSAAVGAIPTLLTTALDALTQGDESLLKSTAAIVGGTVAGIIGGFLVGVVAQLNRLLTPEGLKALVTGIDDLVMSASKAASDIIVGFVQGIVDTLNPGGAFDVQAELEKLQAVLNPQQFGEAGGQATRENIKSATGFDFGVVGKGIEDFLTKLSTFVFNIDTHIGAFQEQILAADASVTAAIAAVDASVLNALAIVGGFFTDKSNQLIVFQARIALANAETNLAVAKIDSEVATVLDAIVNGILGVINSMITSVNSFVASAQSLISSIPFVGDSEALDLPEIGEIEPINLSVGTEAKVADLEAAAAEAKAGLDTALAKLKVVAPPLEVDTVAADTAGQGWSLAYLGGVQAGVTANADAATQVGTDLATGITTGAKTTLDNSTLATDFITAQKTALEAQSPSQLAFRDLGVPIGQGIIDGAVTTLVADTTIATTVGNLLKSPGITSSITTSITAITARYTSLTTNLKTLFSDMATAIKDNFADIRESADKDTEDMIKDLNKAYKKFVEDNVKRFETYAKDLVTIFENLSEDLIEITDEMVASLDALLSGFVNRVISEFRRMRTEVTEAVDSTADAVSTAFNRIKADMERLSKDAVDAAIAEFQRLTPAIKTELGNVITALTSDDIIAQFQAAGKTLGKAIVDSIVDGIRQNSGGQSIEIADAIISIIDNAIDICIATLKDRINPDDGDGTGPGFRTSRIAGCDCDETTKRSAMDSLISIGLVENQLVQVNEHLLAIRGAVVGGASLTAGMVVGASVAGTVVGNGGVVNNYYDLTMNGISQRTAVRAASSFKMFERMNG